MNNMKRISLSILMLTMLFSFSMQAQKSTFSPINTAVPMLSIAPDARGGGMGDNGLSTLPDVNSQYWNPAKYAFMYSKAGVSLSYTPWLRKLVNDVALAQVAGFYKLGNDDNQAIAASLRYFSLGEVPLYDMSSSGTPYNYINPYDMSIDISYSRKLSDIYSMSVALRYIRSDFGSDDENESVPGNAFSADISGYMEKYVILGNSECLWSLGFNVSNIGSKISYNNGTTNQFLPTKLAIGTGLLYPIDEYNSIGFYLDASKLLVPSLPLSEGTTDEEKADYEKRKEDYNTMSPITGIFKSFTDSPNGANGELQEIRLSIGAEYCYNNQFFLRGGYYYENPNIGNRQYFSAGAGFRMSVFELNAAYLISTVQSNPLDQTLRFSLSFDMDGLKHLLNY